MAQTKRFLFDKDFEAEDAAAKAAAAEPPVPTFSAEDVATARAAGHADGRTSGLAEARASIENAAVQAMGAISAKLVEFLRAQAAKAAEAESAALALAVAIARKAVPAIAEAHAAACVETLIRDNLPNFMAEPRIVVRVAEGVAGPIKPRLDAAIASSGFAGKVILLAEPSLAAPDCRIEWADGGVEVDTAGAWRRIEESLARLVSAPSPDAVRDVATTANRTNQ